MGWEIADDDWDDALGAVDVDAMVAARRRNGPLAGSNQPAHQQPTPQWHHPTQQTQHRPNQTWQRQPGGWGGPPAQPQPGANNAAGFSGHTGYKGGFSGHDGGTGRGGNGNGGGGWGGSTNRPRSNLNTGHPAVDKAMARGGAHLPPDRNQRTVNDMFAKKNAPRQVPFRPGVEDKQRTLDSMFGGGGQVGGQTKRPMEPPGFRGNAQPHAHEMPIDLDRPDAVVHCDYDGVFGGGTAVQTATRGTQNGPDSQTPRQSGGRADAGLTPSALGTPNSQGLVRSEAGVMLDPIAAQTYVYPAQLIRRDYQYQAVRRALYTNSLVCLPTGLGKTLIAAVVMYNFYRWFPKGKIVFLAPTRPLVDQQKAACSSICGIPTEDTCTMMGSTKKDESGTRRVHWRSKRVFFCTPQTMENDINSSVCPANEVVCVVIDEAHRAKGNHSYVGCIRMLWDRGVKFRTLALSATPGRTVQDVQKVIQALNIGRIDFKSDQDADVKKHTHNRKIEMELVKATSAQEEVLEQLRDVIRPILKKACGTNTLGQEAVKMSRFIDGSSKEIPAPFTLQMASNESRAAAAPPAQKNWAYNLLAKASYIARIAESLMKYSSPDSAMDYMVQNDHKPFVKSLYDDNESSAVMRNVKDMLQSMAGNGAHHSPKMVRLEQIIRRHFAKNDPNTRIIVFTSFRDSVHDIVRALREVTVGGRIDAVGEPTAKAGKGQKSLTDMFKKTEDNAKPADADANHTESRIKVAEFIGQGDTTRGGGGGKGAGHARGTRGQTQQQQRDVLDAFRNGTLNTLVATSIGEEGLDIPSVDLIVFFDVVDTIRTIQRMGRTGRARDGRVVVLAQEGREAEKFRREQSSYDTLIRALNDPERVFEHCRDCPRMLPEGLKPSCDLQVLGPTPEELAAQGNGAPKSSGKKRGRTNGSFSVRPWDAPFSHVETSLLFTYAHEPNGAFDVFNCIGASLDLDLSASAPLQRRPTAVHSVPHGAMSRAMMRAMCAAQELPPPRDVEGTIIASGAIARGREAAAAAAAEKERERSMRQLAGDEDGEMAAIDHTQDRLPDEAFYAPPLDEYGDGWDGRDEPFREPFREPDDDDAMDHDGGYVEPTPPNPAPETTEREDEDANEEGGYGWTGGQKPYRGVGGDAEEAAEDVEDDPGWEVMMELERDARDTGHTGATQRLDFSTQQQQQPRLPAATGPAPDAEPCGVNGCATVGCVDPAHASTPVAPTAPSPHSREPLVGLVPPSQQPGHERWTQSAFVTATQCEPSPVLSAAEAARRRLHERLSQQRQSQASQPPPPTQHALHTPRGDEAMAEEDVAATQRSLEDEYEETLDDIAFHLEQKELVVEARRKSESAEKASREMPPPPSREPVSASPARRNVPDVQTPATGGGGWGGGEGGWGSSPKDDAGGGGWGSTPADGKGWGWGGASQDNDDAGGWGGTQDDGGGAWGGGGGGWGGTQEDGDGGAWGGGGGGGWGASQDEGNAGGWGWGSAGNDADANGWGQPEAPASVPPASHPRQPQPTPESEDLKIIKRRPRAPSPSQEEDEPAPRPKATTKANRTLPSKKKTTARGDAHGLAVKSRRTRNAFIDDEAEGDGETDEDAEADSEDDGFIDDGSPPESPWTQPDGAKGGGDTASDDDDADAGHHAGAMLEETPAVPARFVPKRRIAEVQDTPEDTGVTPAGQSQYEGSWIVDDEDDVEEEGDTPVDGGGWGTGGGAGWGGDDGGW